MRAFAHSLRVLLGVIALAVALISLCMNALFWWNLYADEPQKQYGFLAASVAFSFVKIGLPALIVARRTKWFAHPEIAFVFLVAFSFDVWSGLGYQNQARSTIAAEATEITAKRKD